MREIKMADIPQCNFCHRAATYDAPTLSGPWAYMCERCYEERKSGCDIGSKLIKRRMIGELDKIIPKTVKIVMPTEEDMESACFDGLWYPKCPYCDCSNACEPDGGFVYCDDCGKRYKVGTCC